MSRGSPGSSHIPSQESAVDITLNGVRLAVRDMGAGPAIVFVHGYTGCKDDWADHLAWLSETWRVVAYDHRGHGSSGRSDAYSLEILVEDLAALVDRLDLDRFVLVGHSMGGMVAQLYALDRPERLMGLVLQDTGSGSPPVDERRRQIVDALARLARKEGMGAVLRVQETAGGVLPPNPAEERLRLSRSGYTEYKERKLLEVDPTAYADLLESMLDQKDRLDRLADLRVPTLVIVGEHDRPFLRISHKLADRVPGARLVVIDDAGHSPQFESPSAWRGEISGFLDTVRSSR